MQGPPAGSHRVGTTPAVSVIVPGYGVSEWLGDALRSLEAQDHGNWEAIVADDGDPAVRPALAPFEGDQRIRLLMTGNGGVSAARNRAIAAARAPALALLDGDDAYEPDFLSTMLAALGTRHGFATCDASFVGGTRDGRRFSEYLPQDPPVTLERVVSRRFNVFTASVVRRESFEAAGGYDETLSSGEDLDLWIRILETGRTAAYVPRPLVRYRRRNGSLSGNTAAMLEAVARVQANAARRLEGRPEAKLAGEMRDRALRDLAFAEGEEMIREGRVDAGLGRLRDAGAHRRSPAWAAAMAAMRVMPALARPLQRWRDRTPD